MQSMTTQLLLLADTPTYRSLAFALPGRLDRASQGNGASRYCGLKETQGSTLALGPWAKMQTPEEQTLLGS